MLDYGPRKAWSDESGASLSWRFALVERKARLKRLLRRKRSRVLYVDHIETDGAALVPEGMRGFSEKPLRKSKPPIKSF